MRILNVCQTDPNTTGGLKNHAESEIDIDQDYVLLMNVVQVHLWKT